MILYNQTRGGAGVENSRNKIEDNSPLSKELCKKSRIFLSAIFTFYYFLFKLFLIKVRLIANTHPHWKKKNQQQQHTIVNTCGKETTHTHNIKKHTQIRKPRVFERKERARILGSKIIKTFINIQDRRRRAATRWTGWIFLQRFPPRKHSYIAKNTIDCFVLSLSLEPVFLFVLHSSTQYFKLVLNSRDNIFLGYFFLPVFLNCTFSLLEV